MTETPDLIGKQLGSYVVLSLIGSGGMARVYRGFDQNLQRPVAIKVLSQEAAAQSGFAERFRQEALLIAGLHHPHIVQVYNFGQQDGYIYMVQELLTGPTLAQYLLNLALHGQLLGRQDIISVTTQLASALDGAHAAGIVHRDVKPANALWNAAGALVLTDFGVARHILTERHQVQTGLVIGTPDYLSPEQAEGLPGTQASDIYGLGVVVYELITGRVPFQGETRDEVLQQHMEVTPQPMQSLRSDVLPAVEMVVQRALAKDPEARFASAGELARALKRAWPPIYGRANRMLPVDQRNLAGPEWEQVGGRTPSTGSRVAPATGNIYNQTTVISAEMVSREPRTLPESAARSSVQAVAVPAVARRPSGGAFSFVLSLLVLVMIVSGVIVALQEDYQRVVRLSASTDLVAPPVIPTAQVWSGGGLPTGTPTPVAVAGEPAIGSEPALVAPTPASIAEPVALVATTDPTTVALLATTQAEPATMTDQFNKLRILIETDTNEGWARIDRAAWLNRLDDIQRAVEAGDTLRAASWLQEMRQTLLHTASNGTISPDVVERVVTDIERIASNSGILLPPVPTPMVDDG